MAFHIQHTQNVLATLLRAAADCSTASKAHAFHTGTPFAPIVPINKPCPFRTSLSEMAALRPDPILLGYAAAP